MSTAVKITRSGIEVNEVPSDLTALEANVAALQALSHPEVQLTTVNGQIAVLEQENDTQDATITTLATKADVDASLTLKSDKTVTDANDDYLNELTDRNFERAWWTERTQAIDRMYKWSDDTYKYIQRLNTTYDASSDKSNVGYDFVVIGSGSGGLPCAEVLAHESRIEQFDWRENSVAKKVLVIERGGSRGIVGTHPSNRAIGISDEIQAIAWNSSTGYNKKFGEIYPLLYRPIRQYVRDSFAINAGENNTFVTLGNTPVAIGGGSAINGGNFKSMPVWVAEKMAARAQTNLFDMNTLKQCTQYITDRFMGIQTYISTGADPNIENLYGRNPLYPTHLSMVNNKDRSIKDREIYDSLVTTTHRNNYLRSSTPMEISGIYGHFNHFGQPSVYAELGGRQDVSDLLEQYANYSRNLDVIMNADVSNVVFVSESSNTVNAINVTHFDGIEKKSLSIPVKENGGKVVLAGGVYQSASILERSGVGKDRGDGNTYAGVTLTRVNEAIGENWINNHQFNTNNRETILYPVDENELSNNQYNYLGSELQVRKLAANGSLTNVLKYGFDLRFSEEAKRASISMYSGRSTFIINNGQKWRQGGTRIELTAGKFYGTAHADELPFLNVQGATSTTGPGLNEKRNLAGMFEALKIFYNYYTSREIAYFALGTGRDSNGNLVYADSDGNDARHPLTIQRSAEFENDPLFSVYEADPTTGVYVFVPRIIKSRASQSGEGTGEFAGLTFGNETFTYVSVSKSDWNNSNTATKNEYEGYSNLETGGVLSWYDLLFNKANEKYLYNRLKADWDDSQHYGGTMMYGKALDGDFKVKGLDNVYCACAASHNIRAQSNWWGAIAAVGRYVGLSILGKTTPPTPAGSNLYTGNVLTITTGANTGSSTLPDTINAFTYNETTGAVTYGYKIGTLEIPITAQYINTVDIDPSLVGGAQNVKMDTFRHVDTYGTGVNLHTPVAGVTYDGKPDLSTDPEGCCLEESKLQLLVYEDGTIKKHLFNTAFAAWKPITPDTNNGELLEQQFVNEIAGSPIQPGNVEIINAEFA